MKVFNWVHRRFLPIHSCSPYPQENGSEKGVRSKVDVEKHALLEHGGHVIVDMLNDWNDGGILAIGTLAIGPLDLETTKCEIMDHVQDDFGHDHDHVENNHDDYDYDHDHDHDHDYDQDVEDDDYEAGPLMKVAFFSHELEKVEDGVCKNTQESVGEDNNNNYVDLKDKNESQIKRRVTLADLFSEDSDHHLVNKFKNQSNDAPSKKIIIITKPKSFNIKPTSQPKHGLYQAKKFLKEELSPLKKLNQLMKRMMKKKIHPDMEMKMQEKDIQMQPINGLGIPTNHQYHQYEPNESASLLLIPDSMI